MNNTGRRFKLSALTLAMLASTSSAFANQQSAEEEVANTAVKQSTAAEKKDDKDDVEVIKVSGFKGSLLKSMNEKRFSKNVSDSIFAEDIGKSTDQNIADALSRVTGVSVQTEDGEGTRVTVRGANPNQNMITLNGVQLTSADFNQAVDLSTFSSDILSSIKVVKTPSADHDEGSLGASVELNTARPLSLSEHMRSLTIQGRYNDFSEEEDHKISGTLSQTWLDDTIGVLVTAFTETSSVRRDQMSIDGYQVKSYRAAQDLDGNVITDFKALTPDGLNYQLFQNQRDRHGANVSFQLLPTDSTNIMLDLNYSKFEGEDVFHGAVIRNAFPQRDNFVAGVPSDVNLNGQDYIPTFSDPSHEWTTVDTQNRTVVRELRRFADGGYNRRNVSQNTKNFQAGLRIEQEITDNLRTEVGVNYSNTELRPEPSFTANVLSGNNPAGGRLQAGPVTDPHTGIQPAGFDCSQGPCRMVFGDGLVSINNPFNPFDNTSRTAWNPDDLDAHNVNTFRQLERKVDDEQRTAYVNFDWDVDFLGITQIEFGGKWRKRKKTTDDQSFSLENTSQVVLIDFFDDDGTLIGQRALNSGGRLRDIPTQQYAFESDFPYDNFLRDLGVPEDAVTDGWALVSAERLRELAFGLDDLELTPNPANFRESELEHQAAYLKFNYEYMDGRLTGDLGVRYIKTESESFGSSGITFAGDNAIGRVYDPFLFRQLRDITLPECTIPGQPRQINQFAGYNRIDGLGWDFTQNPPVRIPADAAGYPCHDPLALPGGPGSFIMARHQDISRARFWVFGDDVQVREDGSPIPESRHEASFDTIGGNEYDMFLPSLNINYQFGDDLIGRFAVSKTISRANIDSLRPGFTLNENFWSGPDDTSGSLNLFNAQLLPQESKNLDLSLEWYFSDTGLLSAAFFFKDMSNFEENEEATVYLEDLRHVDLTQPYNLDNLILSEEQVRANLADPSLIDGVGYGACFPDRGNLNSIRQDWWFDEEDGIGNLGWCSEFAASRLRNGKGAEIKGVELGYTQTYDFLPGFWSGLGVQANYTYQESTLDSEPSDLNPGASLPEFPRAWTPKHSYNATVFWEKSGHQIRLAWRGKSDELVNRFFDEGRGAVWQEGSSFLDLSAAYKISDTMRISFQALNLTDESTRRYFTSRTSDLGDTALINGVETAIPYDEGNPLEDSSVTTSRTQLLSKTGRTFRIDFRVDF